MSWASILLALVKATGALATYFHDQKLISSGQAIEAESALRGQADALKKAMDAREAVHSDLARNPGNVMQDDGFKRHE